MERDEQAGLNGFRGAWLLTGLPEDAPMREGAVVLDRAHKVLAVGPGDELERRYPHARWQRSNAILMPGLVNAHVHLELSALRGQTKSGGGFGPWVTSLMERRDLLAPEQDSEAIEAGVSELLRTGTVAIGEVTNTLRSVEALATAPLLGRVFHEIFGLSEDSATTMRGLAEQARENLHPWPSRLGYALAPHTLYSLHPSAVREIVAAARESGQRTSLHLAEHAAERAFLRDGSGPFAEFLARRGVPAGSFVPPGLGPVDYALALGVLGPEVLAIHLCATERAELERVRASGAQVVLCPRSNLFIELKLPPLYDVLAVGIRPALGTDSLASNTTLDVLAEAAALRDRFPQVDPRALISMATWYGAEALGLSHRVGALREGLSPGLIAFELERPTEDPLRHVLRAPPPARTVLARPALPGPGQSLEDQP